MSLLINKVFVTIAAINVCLDLLKQQFVMFSMRRNLIIAAIICFLLCVFSVANAAILEVDENLNDNFLPLNFNLININNAGLLNGRLEASLIILGSDSLKSKEY